MEYFAVFVPSLENTGKFAQQTLEITSNSSKFNEFYVKTTFLQFIRNFFQLPQIQKHLSLNQRMKL